MRKRLFSNCERFFVGCECFGIIAHAAIHTADVVAGPSQIRMGRRKQRWASTDFLEYEYQPFEYEYEYEYQPFEYEYSKNRTQEQKFRI